MWINHVCPEARILPFSSSYKQSLAWKYHQKYFSDSFLLTGLVVTKVLKESSLNLQFSCLVSSSSLFRVTGPAPISRLYCVHVVKSSIVVMISPVGLKHTFKPWVSPHRIFHLFCSTQCNFWWHACCSPTLQVLMT